MALSESGQIIGRLREAGLSMETIGRAVDRNRSLIRQVGIGAKPGTNLRDSLAALEARLSGVAPDRRQAAARAVEVPKPARRTTSSGKAARTRAKQTVGGSNWSSTTAKRQGARGGAKGAARTLAGVPDDHRVAATISFNRSVTVSNTSGGTEPVFGRQRGQTGRGGVVELDLGRVGDVRTAADVQHGGNVSAYVVAQAMERGMLSGVSDERDAVQAMESLEVRTWSPRG